MIRTKISLSGLVCVLLMACAPKATFTQEALDYCLEQTSRSLEMLRPYDYMMSPRNVAPGDSVWHQRPVCKELWTEGFWPGVLWYAYEYSKDETVLEAAKGYTEALEKSFYDISAKLYQQQQQAQGDPNAQGGAQGSDGTYYNADFEDKTNQ
jgi:unsaturated chondroitin disaccharide hydrolase